MNRCNKSAAETAAKTKPHSHWYWHCPGPCYTTSQTWQSKHLLLGTLLMLLALTFLPSTSLTDGWIPNAPDDSHRVVTATSFLANTACPSRQQNWDNCRGMDSDINWGSRLKTQLCLLAGTPGNSVFILPCSRAPSNNRQRNTKEEKDMPPGAVGSLWERGASRG